MCRLWRRLPGECASGGNACKPRGQPETAARTCFSMASSRSLTCCAPNPMKPPSLAASAAACAAATSHCPKATGFIRLRLGGDQCVHGAQLLKHLHACGRSVRRGSVPAERTLPLLRHGLDFESHLGEELLTARRVRGALERRDRFLRGLDGAARVGERDRHPGHKRCPHDLGPLVLGEVTLRRHSRLPFRLRSSKRSHQFPEKPCGRRAATTSSQTGDARRCGGAWPSSGAASEGSRWRSACVIPPRQRRVQPTYASEPAVGPGCVKTSFRSWSAGRSGSWPN